MSDLDMSHAADTGINTVTVHATLRKAILAGELAPGRTLSQVQLAKQYGVSRIPVREALRRLQEEGLVEGERNHRLRVASLSLTELEALYTQRILLESFGVYYTVPRLDEAALTSLEGTLGHMDNLGAQSDLEGWAAGNTSFHEQLVAHVNPHLKGDIRRYAEASVRYRRLRIESGADARVVGQREHRAILTACRDRNAQQAAGLLARHLARTALSIIAEVRPEHDPVTLRTALQQVLAGSDAADSFGIDEGAGR